MESISNTFNGAAGFSRSVVAQISRNGDLIHRVYLQVDLPALTAGRWVDYVGLRLLKYVEIEIGGQRINLVGAQKHQAVSNLCKDTGKTFGGSQSQFFDQRTINGIPQMLVSGNKLPWQHNQIVGNPLKLLVSNLDNDLSKWLRIQLRYGKNPKDESVNHLTKEMGNPQQSFDRHDGSKNVQRLDGYGCEVH